MKGSGSPAEWHGPLAAAFYGGWSTARIVHWPSPAAVADISGAYGWSYSTQGLQRFDLARAVTTDDMTGSVTDLANDSGLRERLIAGQIPFHGQPILVKVRPHGSEILPTKPKRSGNVRLAMAPTELQGDHSWWWLSDVLAGVALGGPFPSDIVHAVKFVANGMRAGIRPVILPGGQVVDPRKDDLLVAMRHQREHLSDDASLAPWQRDGWAGLLRLSSSIVAFGNRARLDRDTLQTATVDEVVFQDNEHLFVKTDHPERPGPHFNLLIVGAVTSRIRLALAQVIGGLESRGSAWLHVATDAVTMTVTHASDPRFVPCPGGRERLGRMRGHWALPVREIQEILRVTGAPWKLKDGFEEPMVGYVSGTYKTALVNPDSGEGTATEAMLGGVYLDPTGTGERTEDGRHCWAVAAHLAVAKAGREWTGKDIFPEFDLPDWADRPAIRPGIASTPEIVGRVQRTFPDRTIRPYAPYWIAVVDPFRSPAVPVTLDTHLPPDEWLSADWRDQRTGEPLVLTLDDSAHIGTVRARAIREVLWSWGCSPDPTVAPVRPTDHVLTVGLCEPVPVRSRSELFEPTGKEGDDLLSLMTDPLAERDSELTIYRRADTWLPILEVAQSLDPAEFVERTGLKERTARRILRGGRPSPETAALVGAALGDELPKPPRSCGRPGCPSVVTGRQVYCTDSCRKAADRAKDRLHLWEIGAVRCRRCDAVRYGDQSGPCPACGGKAVVIMATAICQTCGVERVGNVDGQCPFCNQEDAE
jgi:hypothetical protein